MYYISQALIRRPDIIQRIRLRLIGGLRYHGYVTRNPSAVTEFDVWGLCRRLMLTCKVKLGTTLMLNK